MVRRLHVIQTESPEDEAAARRPQWQWVVIGAGLAITVWLPLAALALPLGTRLASRLYGLGPSVTLAEVMSRSAAERAGIALVSAGPVLLMFGLACGCAGAIVGYFGRRPAVRVGGLSGFAAAALLWSFTAVMGAQGPWPMAVFSLAVLAATGSATGALGAVLGARRRR